MLITNVDVSEGLVNGARVHVVTSDNHILVKFNHPDVGAKAKQSSRFRQRFPTSVPIKKHEAMFRANVVLKLLGCNSH